MNARWDWVSVIIYCLISFICVYCIKKANHKNIKQKQIYYSIWLFIWVIFASFRYYDYHIGGTDTLNYVEFFENINSGYLRPYFQHYNIGYWVFNRIIRFFTSNVRIYFIILYSIITISYVIFIDELIPENTYYAPYFLVFFLYLRSFNTFRTNLSVALLLFSLIEAKHNKKILSILLMIISCSIHVSSILYAPVIFFYWIYKKRQINIKESLIFAVIFYFVGLIGRTLLPVIFDSSLDAYASYSMRNVGVSFFSNFWKIVFGQLVLLIFIIIFNQTINQSIEKEDPQTQNNLLFVKILCIYDLILIPTSFLLGFWRAPEYLYLARIIMWGYLLRILSYKYFTLNSQIYIIYISYIIYIFWFINRLGATWEDSGLLPYIFFPFNN